MNNLNFKRGASWPLVGAIILIIALAIAWWYSTLLKEAVNRGVTDYQSSGQIAISSEFSGSGRIIPTPKATTTATTTSNVKPFDVESYKQAASSGQVVGLYFYAKWCNECKAEYLLFEKEMNKLNKNKAIGFQVNYRDSETSKEEAEVARQFAVTVQNTKVLIKDNKRLLKSTEAWTATRYQTELTQALGE